MSKAKRNSLLFLSAAGLLTILLVMSLPTLSLSPGGSFSLGKTDVTMPGVTGSIPGGEAFLLILRGLIALAFIALSIYILYSLFSAQGRRRLMINLIVVAALLWIVNSLEKFPPSGESEAIEGPTSHSIEDLDTDTAGAVFSEDSAPPWLAVAVILIVSTFSVGLLFTGIWFFRRHMAQTRLLHHPLAEIAQEAIESLQTGRDFRSTIIQCYHQMNRVIKEERGIAREVTMTPREFETHLINRGFPQHALETLTRLFEQVRYGSAPSRPDDETMAFTCLTEIVTTCKAAKISHDEQ